MKFTPLHDKVLVKRTEEEEMSAGGIVLPGSACLLYTSEAADE